MRGFDLSFDFAFVATSRVDLSCHLGLRSVEVSVVDFVRCFVFEFSVGSYRSDPRHPRTGSNLEIRGDVGKVDSVFRPLDRSTKILSSG